MAAVGCSSDNDGDGYKDKTDCDDTDPYIFPNANEVCDEIDNDCDRLIDDDDEGVVPDRIWTLHCWEGIAMMLSHWSNRLL